MKNRERCHPNQLPLFPGENPLSHSKLDNPTSGESPLPMWHKSQVRPPNRSNPVFRAIASDVRHDWTEKKRELGLPTPSENRRQAMALMSERVTLLHLHGIDIDKPLTLDQIEYLLENGIPEQPWHTDATSSTGITIFPSEDAWTMKLDFDTKDGKEAL